MAVINEKLENIASIKDDIRDAIAAKGVSMVGKTFDQYADAIGDIQTPSALEEKTITMNGTYLPSAGKDGFSKVIANIPSKTDKRDPLVGINIFEFYNILNQIDIYKVPFIPAAIYKQYISSGYSSDEDLILLISSSSYVQSALSLILSTYGQQYVDIVNEFNNAWIYGYLSTVRMLTFQNNNWWNFKKISNLYGGLNITDIANASTTSAINKYKNILDNISYYYCTFGREGAYNNIPSLLSSALNGLISGYNTIFKTDAKLNSWEDIPE